MNENTPWGTRDWKQEIIKELGLSNTQIVGYVKDALNLADTHFANQERFWHNQHLKNQKYEKELEKEISTLTAQMQELKSEIEIHERNAISATEIIHECDQKEERIREKLEEWKIIDTGYWTKTQRMSKFREHFAEYLKEAEK